MGEQNLPIYLASIWHISHHLLKTILGNGIYIGVELLIRFPKHCYKSIKLIYAVAPFKKNCPSDQFGKNTAH